MAIVNSLFTQTLVNCNISYNAEASLAQSCNKQGYRREGLCN